MRDLRNDFLMEIKMKLMNDLTAEDISTVVSALTQTLDKYEISERNTAIVAYEDANLLLVKTYASHLMIDGKSEKTIKAYSREIMKFIKFIAGRDLKSVKTFDIRNYLAQEKVRGISNRTLENNRANLSAFFQWMTTEEYIQHNPCLAVKPIKYTEEIRRPFSVVDLDKLRSSCADEKERAIVEVLLSSGVRVSELVGLDLDDINFDNKTLRIRHGKGDKERYTYISDVAKDHLIRYLTERNIVTGPVFRSRRSDRYTAGGIETLLKTLSQRSNVENVHPHRFRRTFATTLAARGMDIQDIKTLMGHTSINTTMVYVALDNSQINISYRKYTA